MITLTERAATKVNEFAEADNMTSFVVRLRVLGGGCAGFQHDMYLDDKEPGELDEIFDCHGVRVTIDPMSFQYLDGVEIDYVESDMVTGFKFNNPNSKGTCGCGSSFNT
jgi:iron-sulfur cluster insertion protein